MAKRKRRSGGLGSSADYHMHEYDRFFNRVGPLVSGAHSDMKEGRCVSAFSKLMKAADLTGMAAAHARGAGDDSLIRKAVAYEDKIATLSFKFKGVCLGEKIAR